MGAYWLNPSRIAFATSSTSSAFIGKSGNPCPRLMDFVLVASALITVKMVVPTLGSLLLKFMFFYSWQLAVGSWQLAVGSWQLAVGSRQLAVGSWRLAVGRSHSQIIISKFNFEFLHPYTYRFATL